jgi:predicted dienelactone hydrolase
VGFEVFAYRDGERKAADGGLRPVQASVWYPALRPSARGALRYRDYVLVSAAERTLSALPAAESAEALAGYRAFLERNGVPAAGVDAWLDTAMNATQGAVEASGAFPVVLIAQGMGGAVHDQAALAEFLASHGYVVATTPSPVRLGGHMESDMDVLPMARDQARDLEIALERVRERRRAGAAPVGLVGYSFGARPALLLAPRLGARALVSLDGGIGSSQARGWLPARALDRSGVRTPLLHVYEDADESMTPDFALLATLSGAPRTLAKIEGMRHLDFITYGAAAATLPALGAPDPARLGQRVAAAFALTRAFLDAHLKGDAKAWDAFAADPAAAGLAPGLVSVRPFGRR